MPGSRRIFDTAAPIRSSLANAAFAVEERVLWGGAGVLRRAFDALKWPFERVAWAVERGLLWPLQERSGNWSAAVRIFSVAALALLAVGAGALGLELASDGSGGEPAAREVAAPVAAPVVTQVTKPKSLPAAPVLHGSKPDFDAEADAGTSAGSAEIAAGSPRAPANSTSEVATSGTAAAAAADEAAGPAAIKVAHQFAGAFLLFETGRDTAKVRAVFSETATPQLAHSLLRRPPRLPAGVKVPKAKVLNVVPGPQHGDTYTLSVSLLRVGITSELRLNVQCDPKAEKCKVEDVLG